MKNLIAVAAMIPFAALADELNCSIKAPKLTTSVELMAMAKISQVDAQRVALGAVNVPGTTISESKLKVEDGCLVYSVEVAAPGKRHAADVYVDAGTGQVIKNKTRVE